MGHEKGGVKMKTRELLLVIILLSAVPVLLAANAEEYWGTWVNRDYNADNSKIAVLLLKPDGSFAQYNKESDADPFSTGTITIKDKWTDSKGNIWYKVTFSLDHLAVTNDHIMKLSDAGMILEYLRHTSEIPAEMDPSNYNYRIMYHK